MEANRMNEMWTQVQNLLKKAEKSEKYLNLLAEMPYEWYNEETHELRVRLATRVLNNTLFTPDFMYLFYTICQVFGRETNITTVRTNTKGESAVRSMQNAVMWQLEFDDFSKLIEQSSPMDQAMLRQLTPVFQNPGFNIFKVPYSLLWDRHLMDVLHSFYLFDPVFICEDKPENVLELSWEQTLVDYDLAILQRSISLYLSEIHPVRQQEDTLYVQTDSYATYWKLTQDRYLLYCMAENFGCRKLLVQHPAYAQDGQMCQQEDFIDTSWYFDKSDSAFAKRIQSKLEVACDFLREKIQNQQPLGLDDDPSWCNKYLMRVHESLTPEVCLEVLSRLEIQYMNPYRLWLLEYCGDELEKNEDLIYWVLGVLRDFSDSSQMLNAVVLQG